ncbi:RNA 5'-monophosphate methyltransferase [Latimeria chalumnae]|uniref:RNA methyltransferase n=1 Tax=Latimeria chalumnae TaxID=7897 RepID=H3BF65_LATCH|nr:PREDICTED: pre-miRNA 5'-monophosphate methyltransferase [Latimeria chalumnae]|eukprot:XP_005986220.1 PREDICTED: pre-miRNA 5'-monophosphate methyltransferase [Latimeria chalumnae]
MAAPREQGGVQQRGESGSGEEAAAAEPGAAPFGNFMNYYRFQPPAERLGLLPAALLRQLFPGRREAALLGLDVGCNSGDLSIALYQHLLGLKPGEDASGSPDGLKLKLLGCDLDAALVQRAVNSNSFPEAVSFTTLDIMDASARQAVLGSYLASLGRSCFDICFCMSVTMWIHLNHGDCGLLGFLSSIAGLTQFLLIEPQPWKCYRSAARRLRKLGRNDFDHFKKLEIKGDVTEKIREYLLADCSMELVTCFGSTNWDRSLLLFKRLQTPPDCERAGKDVT